jgi:hypothetical protein
MPNGTRMAHPIQSKVKVATIRLTPDQHKAIDQRARRCGVHMSVWIRSILLQVVTQNAATDERGRGFLRIREPDGAVI